MPEPAPPVLRCLAVIPARGGSRSLPRRNLRPLAGKPLIAHAIAQTLRARLVDRVVVVSDDLEVAATAGRYGAEVALMPAPARPSDSFSEVAAGHALACLAEQGDRPDMVVMVQPGAPLTRAADIDGTIRTLLDEGADSCFAAAPFHCFLWQRFADGQAVGVNHPTARRPRHREMDPQYIEAGAVYAMVADGFLQARQRFFGRTVLHVMPAERCLQIREPLDLVKAEAILGSEAQFAARAALPDRPAALALDGTAITGAAPRSPAFFPDHDGGAAPGLRRLRETGLPVVVIAHEVTPDLEVRCRRLGIDCIRALGEKLPVLEAWAQVHGIGLEELVYLGSGAGDIPCLRAAGCALAPVDAGAGVRAAADLVLDEPAGPAAVRALAALLLSALESGTVERASTPAARHGT